jgi:hypothetical protein
MMGASVMESKRAKSGSRPCSCGDDDNQIKKDVMGGT